LIRATKAKKCLELGMFTGYGSLSMAEALPADGTVTSLEISESLARYARESFDKSPNGHKIIVKTGDSVIMTIRL
jgi:caffeoyl-CoA O-methyltransferase